MGRKARPRNDAVAVASTAAAQAHPPPLAAASAAPPRLAFEGQPWVVLTVVADAAAVGTVALIAADLSGLYLGALADWLVLSAFALMTVMLLAVRGLYGARPGRMDLLDLVRALWAAVAAAAVVALALGAVTGAEEELSPALLVAAAGSAVVLPLVRVPLELSRRHVRAAGGSGTRTLVFGSGEVAALVERRLLERPELGLCPVGFLDDHPPPGAPTRARVLGGSADLEAVVRHTRSEHVIVAFSAMPDAKLLPLMADCRRLGLSVSLVPRLYETINHRQHTEHLGALPLVAVRQTDPSSLAFAVKHAMSRTIAAVLLVVVFPVFAAIALAVRMSSPGPVLYRQRRIGQDGRRFDMLKFRSMSAAPPRPTVEPRLHAVSDHGEPLGPGGVEGADRRTAVGRFLRRSSLDELPQLINVLLGHMDLVGPRPERPEFVSLFTPQVRRYDERLRVKAGMTGWAQINGLRGQTSLAERVEWDNWYIQNWSLWLDIKILIRTPIAVLRTKVD